MNTKAAMNQWHPACYVGSDPRLRGKEGVAAHSDGDYWTFQYIRHRSAVGPLLRELRVFRTEIDLLPSMTEET